MLQNYTLMFAMAVPWALLSPRAFQPELSGSKCSLHDTPRLEGQGLFSAYHKDGDAHIAYSQ